MRRPFDAEVEAENARILRWSIFIFNPIYVAWIAFDQLLAPAYVEQFAVLRIAAAAINSVFLPLLARPRLRRHATRMFWIWFFVWGAFVAPMLPVVGNAFLSYVLGLAIVLFGAGAIPLWSPRRAASVMLSIVGFAAIVLAIWPATRTSAADLVTAMFFVATVVTVAIVTSWFKFRLMRQRFEARLALSRIDAATAQFLVHEDEGRADVYRYERRLGGGGMAEVFLASVVGTQGFERPVAIKRVLPAFSGEHEFADMFVNEARISAMLRHPNIVQVLDFDRDHAGQLFLVMEYVDGVDLDALMRRGKLPVVIAVHVVGEVLAGLAHAHEKAGPDGQPLGLVHRDISPQNVLVSWDGAVKISDFGIAKAMRSSSVAVSGLVKGKPLYMAPEQVLHPELVDHRADLFAVGVILYELLTGERVYRGASHEEILIDVIQVARGWRSIASPHEQDPELPADVVEVLSHLLAVDRDNRFANAREALDALLATKSAAVGGARLLSDLLKARFAVRVVGADAAPSRRSTTHTAVEDVRAAMDAVTRTVERRPVHPASRARWPRRVLFVAVPVGALAFAVLVATRCAGAM